MTSRKKSGLFRRTINLSIVTLLVMSPMFSLPARAATGLPVVILPFGHDGLKSDRESVPKADNRPAAEMARIIEALEERVRQLEEKLNRMTEPADVPAVARPVPERIEAAVQAQDDEKKQNDGILKFFKDVEVSGVVDGY